MWGRMRKQVPGNTAEVETGVRSPFTHEKRVDLIHLMDDLFPSDGWEIDALKEVLLKKLHRLNLGPQNEEIRDFILNASEDGLLTLIEAMPEARSLAVENPSKFGPRNHYFRTSSQTSRHLEEASRKRHALPATLHTLRSRLNEFLEGTPSPARFLSDGTFQREAFASQTAKVLSDLPSRQMFRRDIDQQLLDGRPLAVLFIDLDDFKSVNDTLGHQGGDRCLERVAEIVGNIVAKRGQLYRYGGDEFTVVLPNIDSREAAATGERIRRGIVEGRTGGKVYLTASIGVACSSEIQDAASDPLIGAADSAAYSAKNSGKDRVVIWEPSMSTRNQ